MDALAQIKEKIDNQSLPCVIALAGKDQYWLSEAHDLICEAVIGKETDYLNTQEFSLDEMDMDEAIIALNTMLFLAQKRLIKLKKIEKISSEAQQKIIDYIDNPSKFSMLLIILENIDKKNKLYNTLISKELLFNFDEYKNLDSIFLEYIKKYKLSFNEEIKNLLFTMSNNESSILAAYLDKLSLSFEGRAITVEDLNNLCVDASEPNVFELARFIAEGDLKKSLFLLGQIKNSGENALKFLGVMAWQFRTILNIRHFLDDGSSEYDIKKKVNIFGDRFTWMVKIAKKNTINFHIQRLTRLLKADRLLKSLNLDEPFNIIEKMVYQSITNIK